MSGPRKHTNAVPPQAPSSHAWQRSSAELLARLAELSRDSVVITDADLEKPGPRIVYANAAFTRMTGYSVEEVIGRSPRLLQGPATDRAMLVRLKDCLRRGEVFATEGVNYRKDGTPFLIDWQISPIRDAQGVITHYVAFQRDITAKKQDEQKLIESEARYRSLVESSPDAMFVMSADRVVFANAATARLLGAERPGHVVGLGINDLLPERWRPLIRKLLADIGKASPQFHQHQLLRFDGTPVDVETVGIPITFRGKPALQVLVHDLTERILLEQQFQHVQRIESIGMLAAGIAHDLNNVLAPILMAVPLLRESAAHSADEGMLSAIETSAVRGAALVRQILAFSQGVAGDPQILQLKHLLHDVAGVLARTFPKTIDVKLDVARDLAPVLANPSQMHQVMLNLCVNARDAMPAGGLLTINARSITLSPEQMHTVPGGRPGKWVTIEVQDTGSGISPEVMQRMWDPFFTTKTSDKGTGLGLSTVRGIVQAHEGFITVASRLGQGTVFRVFLPASEGTEIPVAATSTAPRGNGETILVADDDARIRMLASAVLSRHGYQVLIACDGAEALQVFAARRAGIGLVITDLDMPNLCGTSLARSIRELEPRVPILAMSGIAPPWATSSGPASPADVFIVKPFTVDTVLASVHELLSRERRPVDAN